MNIDLHIHSNVSDGTLSPCEIVALANKLHLAAIAITDHDTIDGAKQALKAGIPRPLKFLSGVEVSANPPRSFPCSGSFHILGYAFQMDDPELNRILERLQHARKNRNPQIIERLNQLGLDISLQEVREHSGKDSQLGRPHIARLMLKKGFVQSIDEAFDKYIGKGKAAYVDKYRASCDEAISMIQKAGGISVLAHPLLLNPLYKDRFEDLVCILKEMGLRGIEVYYPEHSPDHVKFYSEIAKRHDLLITGGTDFHGAIKPDIQMGSGRGNFFVPYVLYEKLIQS